MNAGGNTCPREKYYRQSIGQFCLHLHARLSYCDSPRHNYPGVVYLCRFAFNRKNYNQVKYNLRKFKKSCCNFICLKNLHKHATSKLRSGSCVSVTKDLTCTDKKENKIFLIYKEIQMGSGPKSYMRQCFLIYEEMHKYFHHLWGGR